MQISPNDRTNCVWPTTFCWRYGGDFSSWSADGIPMRCLGKTFTVTLPLAPGQYQYKYIIDDVMWYYDMSSETLRDPMGNVNNVVKIPPIMIYRLYELVQPRERLDVALCRHMDSGLHSIHVNVRPEDGHTSICGQIGVFHEYAPAVHARGLTQSVTDIHEAEALELRWDSEELMIMKGKSEHGFDFVWSTKRHDSPAPRTFQVADAFEISRGGHWFGLGELVNQVLPLERLRIERTTLQLWDNGPNGLGSVIQPAWTNSAGGVLDIATDSFFSLEFAWNRSPGTHAAGFVPVGAWMSALDAQSNAAMPQVDWDYKGDQHLRIFPQKRPQKSEPTCLLVKYHLSAQPNPVTAQKYLLRRLTKPSNPPDRTLIDPIWTSWARFKADISERKILDFAKDICLRKLPRSVFEIDDKWSTFYGDLEFDPHKFPHPQFLIKTLRSLGFKVTVWVTPFAELKSLAFKEGSDKGYFVKNTHGDTAIIKWWNGDGAILDLTNSSAVDWFVNRLKALMLSSGVNGFKFDAGEPCFLPKDPVFFDPIKLSNINYYSRLWMDVADNFEWGEIRCGFSSQQSILPVRLWDRSSQWSYNNGLASVLTSTLQLGLLGYRFTIPDMIGGNNYGSSSLPPAELFIRWVQLNTFLPFMQFSIAPWDFVEHEEVEHCVRTVLEIRETFEAFLVAECNRSASSGFPVIRPVSWVSPSDIATYDIVDQFMFGDSIMVAPVLSPGCVVRKVYLPRLPHSRSWHRLTTSPNQDASTIALAGGRWYDVLVTQDSFPVFYWEPMKNPEQT